MLVALAFASGCQRPCASLAERLCACDQKRDKNRQACDLGRDPDVRQRAESLARQTGVDPDRICQDALDAFRCPE
jgi:hypothetical protein